MGLPSGVQWASCNVGADDPSNFGLYFSWGNIEGHSIDEGYDFSDDAYHSSPAAIIDTNLSLDHDAARANLGAPWRMPTAIEFQELFDNSTQEWTTVNGVRGILVTSRVNGKTIFFPAAGYFAGAALSGRNSYGYYWSSTFTNTTLAEILNFNSSEIHPQRGGSRRNGFTVRAVLQPT